MMVLASELSVADLLRCREDCEVAKVLANTGYLSWETVKLPPC